METAESRAKLANAIRTMQANGQSAQIPSLVSAYKAKYQSTPAPVAPQEKTFGQKVSGGIQKIFPGQKVGQAIGTLAGYALTPKENRKYYDTSAPSVGQVIGDVAQGALTVGTAGGVRTGLQGVSKVGKLAGVGSNALNKVTIDTAKTVGGRALQNTAIGAGFGLTSGIKEKQSVGDTLKSTAIGAGTGLAAGLVLDGAIGAYKGIKRTPAKEIAKTEKELQRIENNYQKLRKNAKFSKDGNVATRKRIASTGVLTDATDATGTINTDKAIMKYKELSGLNGKENVVRKNIERLGESVDIDTIEKSLKKAIYDSSLQGASLKSALASIDNEIAGYRLRANPDGRIPLTLMHDAKIDTYSSIDFNTPAEIKAYKKTLAKSLKEIVEANSSFNVKQVNDELSPILKDIEYLENLNGRKVKGGKLGKYSARIAGNIAGGVTGGSIGGIPGAALGTVVGGEVGDAIQGKILRNTFGNTAETALPESEILKRAVQTGNSPRPQLPAKRPGQPQIQQVSGRTINLPARTQSAVDAQSLANLTAQKIAPPSNIPKKVSISNTIPEKKPKSKLSLKDQRGFIATGYKGEKDLTTKILKDLEGKTIVSKQYILDATNRGELKQVERDLIREVLATEKGDTVNVSDFAKKVKAELLPLKVKTTSNPKGSDPKFFREQTRGDAQYGGARMQPRYEMVNLPDELRGNVKNYRENIYESPIKTSAGETHFGGKTDSYFGHTRIEDMSDDTTRRVIEVQSDLYQKGRIDQEGTAFSVMEGDDSILKIAKRTGETTEEVVNRLTKIAQERIKPLQQYNDPTAHFRMVREELKKAAEDGKTKLQFPTGETAMKIEGLGANADNWVSNGGRINNFDQLKVGQEVGRAGEQEAWIITDVLGDGKFKAVPKDKIIEYQGTRYHWRNLPEKAKNLLDRASEEFDISGKVDTNNPIYKFYEKDVQKYLNKFGGKRVVDDKGVSWIEVPIKKEYGDQAVEAFGKIGVSPLFIGAGAGLVGVTTAGTIKKKSIYKNGK